uniref:Truncated antisigma factor n=1 Tax=Bacillus anthracis TaxID=1392 RepID=B5M6H9_BACAN|nr:truncated antisigma factor [Bacillus anthracis]
MNNKKILTGIEN